MRHRKSGRKLSRTKSHRKATLSALCNALILHKRIETTLAKAKETRRFAEKIITRAKKAVSKENGSNNKDINAHREIFSFLRNRMSISALFTDIAQKVGSRPGGYTRVVKLGRRLGDGAELAVLELVDYNIAQEKSAIKSAKKAAAEKKTKSESKKASADGKISEGTAQKKENVNKTVPSESEAGASEKK